MKEEVEKFLVDGKHYSHNHPLSLREDKEEDDDLCGICRLPILSSPSYNCTTLNCRFLLHQQCAVKFTPTLIHSTHGPDYRGDHILQMIRKRSPSSSSSSSSSPNYTYKCEDCKFETHPLSAVVGGVEIKVKHRSHRVHPLVAVCRETVSLCDACGREEKGFFFTCPKLCNFWIHQHCTILPSFVTLHSHPQPYILTYSPPEPSFFDKQHRRCQLCWELMPFRLTGVYFCPHSASFAHIACATKKPAHQETRLELVQLPDDEWDTFPSRAIRIYYQEIQKESYIFSNHPKAKKKADSNMTIEKYHKQHHPPILTTTITTPPPPPQDDDDDDDDVSSTGAKKSACDLCTQPIHSSSPFHRCGQCPFVTHQICADILPNIHKFFIPWSSRDSIQVELHPDPGKHFFNSVFYCSFCRRPCNGLCSHIPSIGPTRYIDLECMAAPNTVTHASHPNPNHILYRTDCDPFAVPPPTCCPADDTFLFEFYRCIVCNYSVHISCAMLPKRIRFPQYHRPHPLFLIYNASSTSTAVNFCEVCEEGIDPKYWLYRCVECDESYHVNCIPSLGYLSKVKVGGKLSLPPSVHDHPLTLKRMLTLPSQRCGVCKQIIHGMVDEMAFFCSRCHFWLHFSCARNSAAAHTSDHLLLYSDVRRIHGLE